MNHIRIFEDYFGNQNHINKKDVEFFEELMDYAGYDISQWNFLEHQHKNNISHVFSKDFDIEYKRNLFTSKNFKITKDFYQPKNVVDIVSKPEYTVEYDDVKLDLPEEKIKEVFDKLYQEYTKDIFKHANTRKEYAEKDRTNDLQSILKKKVKKYNL